jgi:hypothetical protein
MFLNLQTFSKNNLTIPKEGQPITAHKQKPKSLAKANAICAFAYLQNVIFN